MIFIGDIHGHFDYYLGLIKNFDTPSIQVGDMGIGFRTYPFPETWDGEHYFIRGNHDNPFACDKHPKYLGDFGYIEKWNLFYIGGAESIDQGQRTEGFDYWSIEELHYSTFRETVIPMFEFYKPRIVVAHDCPLTTKNELMQAAIHNGWPDKTSKTERAMQTMFESHQPDLWVFGHYHKSWETRLRGTRFVCVNSLSTFETEI